MSEHDHDYTLTVRPNATLRVAYSTGEGTLEKALLAFEYGHEGIDGMSDDGEGIVWRGYEIALSRNGENVLDRGSPFVESGDVERGLERGVDTATKYGRQLRERIGDLRERRSKSSLEITDAKEAAETPRTVEIPGPRDTTVEIALSGSSATFDLYEDDGGNWRWRLTHDDETLAVSSTGYESREDAEDSITALKTNALGAAIED
ncbi:YegP family protein [Halococcus saccharolyticus]|uniref:DUF1508 domain-containing protein n=1 Tax=Halococcus saccharolyticus DSM 5350 TaxID=1227455 RepID=M0MHK5_9EURY|nr:YegP family protein [Halococcus saccharolyticus]EMA44179.1 hypothetical protein C449_11653 [Halococcus saccharolyticus DSM 5350]